MRLFSHLPQRGEYYRFSIISGRLTNDSDEFSTFYGRPFTLGVLVRTVPQLPWIIVRTY